MRSLFISRLFLFMLLIPQWSAAEKLILVTGEDFKPWAGSSLPQGGIVTEIVQTAFTNAGIETTLQWRPWKRGYKKVVIGDSFATFPYAYSKKRATEVYFSIPITVSGLTIFVRDDSSVPFNYKDLNAFSGMTFCSALGYTFATGFQPLLDSGKIKLYRVSDMKSCFDFIRLKRGDALVINKHVGWNMVKSLYEPPYPVRALKEHELSVYHLAVTRQHPKALKILSEFNQAIEKMEKNGAIELIINRHLTYKESKVSKPNTATSDKITI